MTDGRIISVTECNNYVSQSMVRALLNENVYEWTRVDCPEDRTLGFHLDMDVQLPKAFERNQWLSDNCPGLWTTTNSVTYYFRHPEHAMLYKLSGL